MTRFPLPAQRSGRNALDRKEWANNTGSDALWELVEEEVRFRGEVCTINEEIVNLAVY